MDKKPKIYETRQKLRAFKAWSLIRINNDINFEWLQFGYKDKIFNDLSTDQVSFSMNISMKL